MSAEVGTPVSTVSSTSSAVLGVLRADRRRGLAIFDLARGRAGRDVIIYMAMLIPGPCGFFFISFRLGPLHHFFVVLDLG